MAAAFLPQSPWGGRVLLRRDLFAFTPAFLFLALLLPVHVALLDGLRPILLDDAHDTVHFQRRPLQFTQVFDAGRESGSVFLRIFRPARGPDR